jgi:small subunit ribosomal protein S17
MPKKKNEEEIAETPETTEQGAGTEETVEASAGEQAEGGADVTAEAAGTETEATSTDDTATAVAADAPADSTEQQEAAPAEETPAPVAAPAAEKPKKAAKPASAPAAPAPTGGTASADKKVHKRAERIGIVSSDKMTKTVTVRVDRVVKHPVYRKYVKKRKKFMAHDELGAKAGDKVRIMETRPLSARKRWRVVEIIQKAAV